MILSFRPESQVFFLVWQVVICLRLDVLGLFGWVSAADRRQRSRGRRCWELLFSLLFSGLVSGSVARVLGFLAPGRHLFTPALAESL